MPKEVWKPPENVKEGEWVTHPCSGGCGETIEDAWDSTGWTCSACAHERRAVEKAVAEEREACARIAEESAAETAPIKYRMAQIIARRIRERGKES